MLLKNISFSTPEENILYDDVLLQLAEQDRLDDVLRLWESPQLFVVLGRTGKVNDDVRVEAARRDHVPVVRRSSGGGTVLQGPGCLNYSLILSKERHPEINDLRKSYRYIFDTVIAVLKKVGVEARFQPTSDIATVAENKKLSGNAQKRARKHILHHGTILYGFDLSLIEEYLLMPKDIPEYRQARGHEAFLINIKISREELEKSFKETFKITEQVDTMNEEERRLLNDMVKAKNVAVTQVSS